MKFSQNKTAKKKSVGSERCVCGVIGMISTTSKGHSREIYEGDAVEWWMRIFKLSNCLPLPRELGYFSKAFHKHKQANKKNAKMHLLNFFLNFEIKKSVESCWMSKKYENSAYAWYFDTKKK